MKSSYLLLQLEKLVVYCLVPRPSHHPVFNCSTRNGGGRPGPFCHVNDVSVYLGRQRKGRGGGMVLDSRSTFHASIFHFSLKQERYIFALQTFKTPGLGVENCKIRLHACSFNGGLSPLCLPRYTLTSLM